MKRNEICAVSRQDQSKWMNELASTVSTLLKTLLELCLASRKISEREGEIIMPASIKLQNMFSSWAMRCYSIRFESLWIDTKRIEYLLPLLASRLKNLLLSKFYPERFNSLAPGRNTHTQTATPTPSQTSTGSRQGVDSESSQESQVRSRKQAGGRRQAPPPTLRSANNSSCCQRISHATFLFILFSLLGGKFLACSAAKVALYEIRSIGSWLQLVFLHISLPIATFLLCCLPASLFLPLWPLPSCCYSC